MEKKKKTKTDRAEVTALLIFLWYLILKRNPD